MKHQSRSRIAEEHTETLALQVSQLLFEQDPMHTCCVENDAFDKYGSIAQPLVDQLAAGDTPSTALRTALTESPGDDLVHEMSLKSLASSLGELLNHRGFQ